MVCFLPLFTAEFRQRVRKCLRDYPKTYNEDEYMYLTTISKLRLGGGDALPTKKFSTCKKRRLDMSRFRAISKISFSLKSYISDA
jgi:hypothetical protein